ncbi:hypothetical protein HE1_00029 [Holospora elegans E1]|uniref:Uncharacterized protein n=1 Tax=Holospora elegans E1 TaxID=1427503 RepID=A0A023DXR2_9PROT|nr:hypothetical protein HE1_00029 [Holospora elegans E1]
MIKNVRGQLLTRCFTGFQWYFFPQGYPPRKVCTDFLPDPLIIAKTS